MQPQDQQNVERFASPLKALLTAELDAGNVVEESWHGNWPRPGSTAVLLRYAFITPPPAQLPGIDYHAVNDRHYWQAEYYDEGNQLLLACGFKRKNK